MGGRETWDCLLGLVADMPMCVFAGDGCEIWSQGLEDEDENEWFFLVWD